jgi:ABC-type lipoprotein release transport system permease subunit
MIRTTARLAMRNTLRRRARTLLTTGMVVLGVALLLVALSWVRGASGSLLASTAALGGHARVVDPDFAAREELLPLYENLPAVAPLIETLRGLPGVVAIEPRIVTGVTVTAGPEIGEVFAAAVGGSERYFRERMEARDKLVAGRWFSDAWEGEVIAGARVVEQAHAKVGDELVMLGTTQDGSLSPIKARLVGVVRAGGLLDRQLLIPLPRVQYLADIAGGATELLVYGRRYQDAAALAARVKAALSADPKTAILAVQAWSDREPWHSIASTVRGVEVVIVAIFVLLTALGIWNTMMMSVLERTHEIGVLRAMGLSRAGTVSLFVGEAITISVVGGLLGIALGAYPAWWLETHGIRIGERTASSVNLGFSEVVRGDLTSDTIVAAFALGLLMALLGSLIPALRAASIAPVSAMRTGR